MSKVTPFLWFDHQAEEAAKFYTSVFKDSKLGEINYYDDATATAAGVPRGTAMTASFTLNGQDFVALNGGPLYHFTEAVSFMVDCKDQDEIDYYWEKLSADPESEQCGWLKDKYGLSWQIVPANIGELISSPKAAQAMMSMKKLDIAALKKAGEEDK